MVITSYQNVTGKKNGQKLTVFLEFKKA